MPQDHVPETWKPAPLLAMVTDESSVRVRAIGAIPSDDTAPILVADGLGENMRFSWPSWSPDGGALLVSGTGHDEEGVRRVEVWRVTPDGSEEPTIVFRNDSDSPGVIAPNVPHYVCWSPSSRMAAVVAQTRKGLMLHLVDARRTVTPHALMAGGPLYFAWAPDSRGLAIHLGMDLVLFDTGSRGGPTDASGSQRIMHDMPTFRAPVWTVDGSAFLYTTPNTSQGVTLWKSARDGSGREAVVTLDGLSALVRAPQTDLVAAMPVVDDATKALEITLISLDGAMRKLRTGPISALIWAPDGSAIYYLSPMGIEASITLMRMDLASGERRPLAQFRPSADFSTLLPFFDQFAHSHSLISADGRWLTFAGLAANNGGGGRTGTTPQNGCYVVPSDGSAAPRRVGPGEISFFAPPTAGEAPDESAGPGASSFRPPPLI